MMYPGTRWFEVSEKPSSSLLDCMDVRPPCRPSGRPELESPVSRLKIPTHISSRVLRRDVYGWAVCPKTACAKTTQAISEGGAMGEPPFTRTLTSAKMAGPTKRPLCRTHWVRIIQKDILSFRTFQHLMGPKTLFIECRQHSIALREWDSWDTVFMNPGFGDQAVW